MKSKESLVISGISGRFPECEDIDIFGERLINGECFVTFDEIRWPKGTHNLPEGSAKLRDIDKFDEHFFGYTEDEANVLDPMNRILMEETYSCICDAGINPESLRGSNTGFFFSTWIENEGEDAIKYDFERKENIFSYFASRIAYSLDLRGAVNCVNNACASSLTAIRSAFDSINCGECDRALVVAANITLSPIRGDWQNRLGTLAKDSVLKIWDQDSNGYVKGEAVAAILIQKKSEAKRIHAEILGIRVNVDGYKPEGITFPGWRTQRDLILDTMKDSGITGQDFQYFEAHATGTPVGDPTEAKSIAQAVFRSRTNPLLIGSIKASVGHTEGTSGLTSLAKVIIAYNKGVMAPTLNHNKPSHKIPELFDGSLLIQTKAIPFKGGIVGINNFGFGGGNSTIIVKSFDDKLLDQKSYSISDTIPRLILICGRNNELTQKMVTKLVKRSKELTREFLSLFNEINDQKPEKGMKSRGYIILDEHKKCFNTSVDNCLVDDKYRRPLWFVFTGLGSQWPSMGQSLIKIEEFVKSFDRSLNFLESIGANVKDIRKYLFQTDIKDNENEVKPIIPSLVVLQIAFIDFFNELGVKADGIIGHSIGEIAAAYADRCITAEDALQVSHELHLGISMKEKNKSMEGIMAAVGLSSTEAQNKCFGSLSVVCNNSPNMVTITGSVEDMNILFKQLKDENIFYKSVENNGFAAHSPQMTAIEPQLIEKGKTLNIKPNQRSKRWLSTTFKNYEWSDPLCQWPSGEYFVKNLCRPVLFYDTIVKAPKNSLFVEIGSSDLLRHSIVKSFDKQHRIIYREVLRKDNNSENLFILLSTLGQLYISGLKLDINKLYPKVNYPIPRGTDFISPLIKWDHKKSYFVSKYPEYFSPRTSKSVHKYTISLSEDKFLADHKIDGRVLYPGIGYLYLIWKTMANSYGINNINEFGIEFSDFTLIQATNMTSNETDFKCVYSKESHLFFVEVNKSVVAKGKAKPLEDINCLLFENKLMDNKRDKLLLKRSDFYKELRVVGYEYGPNFQGITQIREDFNEATVQWTGHLISFIDSILQIILLDNFKRFLRVPTFIESIKINPKSLFGDNLRKGNNGFTVNVVFDKNTKEIKTNGFYAKNACLTPISRKSGQNGELVIEKYELISYNEEKAIDESLAQSIENYCKECDKTIKTLKDINNNNNDMNGMDVIEDKNSDKILLKIIQNYYSNNKEMNEVIKEYNLDNDLIQSTLISERFLRPSVDIFVENSDLTKKLRVLEVNTSGQTLYPHIIKIICRTAPGTHINNIEYILCQTNKELLTQNILDSKRIKIFEFDSKRSVIPNKISAQNLIIFRDPNISLTHSKKDMDYSQLFQSMSSALTVGGFLLVLFRDNILEFQHIFSSNESSNLKTMFSTLITSAKESKLEFVCRKSDSFTFSSILFRKVDKIDKKCIEIHISNESLDWLQPLKHAMKDQSLDRIWLTNDEELNGITGLVKALQKEENGSKVRSLLMVSSDKSYETALNIAKQTDLVQNVFKANIWGSFRHISLPELPETRLLTSAQVRQLKPGDLSSFKWSESDNNLWPQITNSYKQTFVDIYYSPLNFKDVMHATSRLPPYDLTSHMSWDDIVLGLEFVGRVRETGARVMGLNSSKALSTDIIADTDFLWSVPDKWSMGEASTVPCVYATAYYALIIRGRLKAGETVLIHSGTGGVGQAAINICLSMGCQVFTTVGTKEKRQWIRRHFPQLSDSCIASSRDVSFEEQIMKETNGRGVDLILNSLTHQMFWSSLRCLTNNGRFCEIGKYQFVNNEDLDSNQLLRNKTFHGIYLDALFDGLNNCVTKKAEKERKLMWDLVNTGIESGVVQPLSKTVFSSNEIESAFRFMASGKHIGKVVVQIREEEPINTSIGRHIILNAIPLTFFNPNKSYIIIGGLGGMGLELMYWMYERNARNFVLTSRSGVKTATQEFAINRLRDRKCRIIISKSDASVISGAQEVIVSAQMLGPVGGLFLLTLVLEDDLIERQTIDKYKRVLSVKSTQALVFDKLLRQTIDPIDYFVAFSSTSCGRGITGQTNYSFANSVVERICDKRRADGLKGLAVQWGYVGDVGYTSELSEQKTNQSSTILGYLPQRIISCFTQLDRFIQSAHSVCSSYVRYDSYDTKDNSNLSILDSICNILGMKDMSSVNANTKLSDLGMDSLMSVEVKNLIERETQVSLSNKDVANITLKELRDGFN